MSCLLLHSQCLAHLSLTRGPGAVEFFESLNSRNGGAFKVARPRVTQSAAREQLAAAASPGSLFHMQIPGPLPGPSEYFWNGAPQSVL